jgi:hypothetical protein
MPEVFVEPIAMVGVLLSFSAAAIGVTSRRGSQFDCHRRGVFMAVKCQRGG